jgi:hypothetical protein
VKDISILEYSIKEKEYKAEHNYFSNVSYLDKQDIEGLKSSNASLGLLPRTSFLF